MSTFFNWCTCHATVMPHRPCPNSTDCIITPHLLIKAEDSVFPCGVDSSGVISIENIVQLKANSTQPAIYTITNYSSNLISSPIISPTEITFQADYNSSEEDQSYTVAQIEYKVQQGNESNKGIIDIIFKSRCTGNGCENGCDQCSGDCIEIQPEISIGGDKLTNKEIRLK